MEKLQKADSSAQLDRIQYLKKKQRKLEELEREHEHFLAEQTQEVDEREREELSKVINDAKKHKYHGGLDNFIDV